MKGVFRHYSTILLMFGVMISFIAFMNGAAIYRQIQYSLAEVNEYQYKYAYTLSISDVTDVQELLQELQEIKGNIVLSDSLYLDADNMYHDAEIIIKKQEEFPYPVTIDNKDGVVILGSELQKLCYEEGGTKRIDIAGQPMVVAGEASSEKSGFLSNKLILEPDSDIVKQYLERSQSCSLECGSNASDIVSSVEAFYKKNYQKYDIYYERQDGKYIEIGSEYNDESFYMVIALFAVVNCISISEFWILRRRKEMIIRKLCGFSNMRLFRLLYGQMLWICGVAVVLAGSLQLLISSINATYIQISWSRLGLSIAFLLVMAFIMVALPVYKASHYRVDRGVV